MKTLRLLIAALVALATPLQEIRAESLPSPPELLLFEPNQLGEVVLMRRERPVIIHMEGLTDYQNQLASVVLEFFARASNLQFKFSNENRNLTIIRAPSISDGDTINPEFLKRFNLPQSANDLVRTTLRWSSGCGFYAFRDRTGRISASIVAIDEHLSDSQATGCLLKTIAGSFGLNSLRLKDNSFSRGAHYLTYILEISAICSSEYEAEGDATRTEKEFVTSCMNEAGKLHFGAWPLD